MFGRKRRLAAKIESLIRDDPDAAIELFEREYDALGQRRRRHLTPHIQRLEEARDTWPLHSCR